MRVHYETSRLRVTLARKADCALRNIDPHNRFGDSPEIRRAVARAAANVEHVLIFCKLREEFVNLEVILEVRIWKIRINSFSCLHITRPEKVDGSLQNRHQKPHEMSHDHLIKVLALADSIRAVKPDCDVARKNDGIMLLESGSTEE